MTTAHPSASHASAIDTGWLNVVAGGLLFIAPWVLGYSDQTAAFVNHLAVGAIVAIAALLVATVHRGFAWVNLAGAAYTLIAIPAYGYEGGAAIGASIVLGVAIAAIALVNGLRSIR